MKILTSFYNSLSKRILKTLRRLILRNDKISPGLYQRINSVNINTITFHLDCPITCRLGDTLFYIDAIKKSAENKDLSIYIICHEKNYWLISYYLINIKNIIISNRNNSPNRNNDNLSILPIGNNTKYNYDNFVVIDIHKYDYNENVNLFILKAVTNLLKYIIKDNAAGYIVVSIDLGSQAFMNSRKKINKLITYSLNYCKINKLECFVITGLSINFSQKGIYCITPKPSNNNDILNKILDNKCRAVFTFDSFTMHYSLMNHKKTFVLFRGKLRKFDYDGHYNKINNTFSNDVVYI